MDRQAISDALGALSVVTWLGAQSPQIYENWRNKSVEGLALPFLISWFAGDFTNFLGCILTHQLPFQTILATYFLFVDVILCAQFAHYSRTTLPPLSEDFPYAQPSSHAPSPYLHQQHRRSRSRKRRSRSSRSVSALGGGAGAGGAYGAGKDTPPYTPGGASDDDPMQRSWMSEQGGAFRAHSSHAASHSASSSTQTSPRVPPRPLPPHSRTTSRDWPTPSTSTTAASTVPPSPTVPERGRTLTRNALPVGQGAYRPFDPSLSTIHGSPSTNGAFMPPPHLIPHYQQQQHQPHPSHVSFGGEAAMNGHLLLDGGAGEEGEEEPLRVVGRQRTSSSRSRPPPPSRRSTSVVFLSVGVLATFGGRAAFGRGGGGGGGVGPMRRGGGRAWSEATAAGAVEGWWGNAQEEREATRWSGLRHPAFFSSPPPFALAPSSSSSSSIFDSVLPPSSSSYSSSNHLSRRATALPLDVSSSSLSSPPSAARAPAEDDEDGDGDDEPYPPRPPGVDWERIIGRINAWACAALYLTSRLPQLWQNFRRRSVEGLAITLFLFAFIGNTLYVLSILTNPQSSTSATYLIESTPYLLGSGGTLCFDLAIMAQSWLYSEKRRSRRERERRRRVAALERGVDAEEAAALLDADADAAYDDAGEDEDGDDGTLRGSARRARFPRSRSTSAKGERYASRSVSTGGGSRARPASTRRTNSTELSLAAPSSSSSASSASRAERGVLTDEPFDFTSGGVTVTVDGLGAAGASSLSGSRSRSRVRTLSGGSSFASGAGEVIREDEDERERDGEGEGESGVTIRAA
ncbi:hypothetical protein JCM6882_009644 [Rhodosporidiobolus microsporus]